jgi:hypothetical protein
VKPLACGLSMESVTKWNQFERKRVKVSTKKEGL